MLIGIKRYQKVLRGFFLEFIGIKRIEGNQDVSRGIKRYQDVSRGTKEAPRVIKRYQKVLRGIFWNLEVSKE